MLNVILLLLFPNTETSQKFQITADARKFHGVDVKKNFQSYLLKGTSTFKKSISFEIALI